MIINKHEMRLSNMRSILRHVINYGPISRSKISRDLSINKVTVSSILEDLLNEKYVVEIGEGESTKSGGRKPLLIEFNPRLGYFINLQIGQNYLGIMSTFANGQINRFEELTTEHLTEDQIKTLILSKIDKFKINETINDLMGISISLHMKVYDNVPEYPIFSSFDLQEILSQKYNVPIQLVDIANAAAVFQRDFSSNNDLKNLICLTVNENVSAGIVIDEQLYVGNNGNAGDITGMNFIIEENGSSKLVNPIDYCSQNVVLNEVSRQNGLNNLSIPEVAKMYVAGNKKVITAIDHFVFSLSLVLNNLVAVFSPQIIFLDSSLIEHLPFLLIQIKNHLSILKKTGTQIQIARESRFAPFLGGYSLLIRSALNLGDKRLRLIP